MATILLALPSCKSLDPAIVASAASVASTATHTHDTIVQRDTLYRHDSVIYRERTIHDTVFVTKEVYRNQRLSTFDLQHSTKADTIVVTEWREKVIEKPPEKYIPKFYKNCTWLFFILLLLLVGIIVFKVWRWFLIKRSSS